MDDDKLIKFGEMVNAMKYLTDKVIELQIENYNLRNESRKKYPISNKAGTKGRNKKSTARESKTVNGVKCCTKQTRKAK